ncbi:MULTISPECIES: vWA domain-containing protein [unclassified Cellulophaga]|uniref:vWA domain-containing protein n=1 Tax=unclassified Cellulophaga TaxID=2634405 RepID=UPI0026E20CA9|nr:MULTISPECIES: vWA domain-containing protein [unclassified Cellulophaga]MDO6492606.1 VWA domain-containing protein [Cellulophaga sp. 2_MG-2023]MDO6493708.1 VWA domain-containing protein [Cellulophaga sp. 3_MG-2023]
MQITTVLWVILAAIFALLVVLFQYYYKAKRRGKLIVLLSFLRFLGIFGVLLLLINPKITKNIYTVEKTKLVVLIDNSASIKNSKSANKVLEVVNNISEDVDLKSKFTIDTYSFGGSLNSLQDSLTFKEVNTNIGAALQGAEDIYRNTNTAIVLITDGNQTLGQDYEFLTSTYKKPIYPIIVGDTTNYTDLKIDQVNKNNFAFLNNKYPVEIYVSYTGNKTVTKQLTITENGKNVFKENITFSKTENSKFITTNIEAKSIGVKKLRLAISALTDEKNTINNTKTIALEVIDEKTNIAIVSNVEHPDLGALKKSIESNEQRSVTIIKPNSSLSLWQNTDVFIFYQPVNSFKNVIDYAVNSNKNSFVITGLQTDWNFLNSVQNTYVFERGFPVQEVMPTINSSFSKFDVSEFSTNNFPPLQSNVSPVFPKNESLTILKTTIRGVAIESPLLSVSEIDKTKQVYLFGEDIWKWRMQTYRNDKDFKSFDDFIGKIILYLAPSNSKNSFTLDYKQVYLGSNEAVINASVFDDAFEFDSNATVLLKIRDKEKSTYKEIPMLLSGFNYKADLSSLPAGDYTFTATVKNTNTSKSGAFTILDYDVEKQFTSSNYKKMNRVAQNTNTDLFYVNNISGLKQDLLSKDALKPVQRSKENIVSLVEFKFLLGLILLVFAIEWFLRKYNGLT